MSYFDTINSTKKAELRYANWYSKLPDHRKARMLADAFQFGFDAIKYNVLKQNPKATKSEIMLAYVQANLKDEFPPKRFARIVRTLKGRISEEQKAL